MRIGYLQYSVLYRDRGANLDYIADTLTGEHFDLVVLPELFTSGYAYDDTADMQNVGEVLSDSPTVKALSTVAKQSGGALVGSIPEVDNGTVYNTTIVVTGMGLAGFQRKMHLPDYERRAFAPGSSINIIRLPHAQVGIMNCFDCWFPALGALLKQMGAEILCVPSCFGGSVTPTILPTRARENQVFVVNCNRIGTEMFDGVAETYFGHSQILSPDGQVLAASGGEEALTFVDVNIRDVDHPPFVSQICSDIQSEQAKYRITYRQG